MDHLNVLFSNVTKDIRSKYALLTAGTTLALLSIWTIHDLNRWRSHDTGGSSPTWAGYWRMTKLRIIRLFIGGHLSDHHPLRHDGEKYLRDSIPPRQWPRPKSREWALPQRLETVPLDAEVHARIFSWTEKFAMENLDFLEYGPSKTEGYSAPAVYTMKGLATRNPDASDPLIGDEIFHAHSEDGSLHVWLSEADLKVVVSRGWGERFPVSVVGLLHPGWGFVYTPRTMAECDVVEEILRVGIEYVAGRKPK